MILGFKTEFPWGEQTNFILKILKCAGVYEEHGLPEEYQIKPKIHTIREGQRIKPGHFLHMATGVRTKNYVQFNKGIPELERCLSVQRFDLIFRQKNHVILFIDRSIFYVRRGDYEWNENFMTDFVRNDGFTDIEQFLKWFKKPVRNGQLIHWTSKVYGQNNKKL